MAFASMRVSTGKLRTLIGAKGYNFAEFAREVRVSKEAIRSYTSAATTSASIKPEILRRIAEKLQVELDELRVVDSGQTDEATVTLEDPDSGEQIVLSDDLTKRLLAAAAAAKLSVPDYIMELMRRAGVLVVEGRGGPLTKDRHDLLLVRQKLTRGEPLTAAERKRWIQEEGGEPPASLGSSPTPTPSPEGAGAGGKPASGGSKRRPARSPQRAK